MLLCATFGYGQVTLKKTWISSDLKYLRIEDTLAIVESYTCRECDYSVNNGTLIFVSYLDFQKKRDPDIHPYLISKLTEDTLLLVRLAKDREFFLPNKDTILFVDSAKIDMPDFKFQKLFFKASDGCYGMCPDKRVEIDSSGNIFFIGQIHKGGQEGFYSGKLDKDELLKLENFLKRSWLDAYPNEDLCYGFSSIGGRNYYFVMDYNDKVRANSDFPYFYRDLVDYVFNCYKIVHLKKITSLKIDKKKDFELNKIPLGKYKSAKGYPDFQCEFINDTLVNVLAASRFYSPKIGNAFYMIKGDNLNVNYELKKLVNLKDTICDENDSIVLFVKVYDLRTNECLPFANINLQNFENKGSNFSADINGNSIIRVKKTKDNCSYKMKLRYLCHRNFEMDITANTSKSITVFLTEEKYSCDYQIRSITKNRIVLTNELGIDLVLEREIE